MNPQEALALVEQAVANRPQMTPKQWGLFWKNSNFLIWAAHDPLQSGDFVCYVPDPHNPEGYTQGEWLKIRTNIASFFERKGIT